MHWGRKTPQSNVLKLRARLINWEAPGVAGLERFLAFERLSIAGYVIEPKAEKRPSQRRHLVISSRASQLDMS